VTDAGPAGRSPGAAGGTGVPAGLGGRAPAAAPAASAGGEQTLAGFQRAIEGTYLERDRRRGTAGTFVWFVEEVGELARALKKGERENLLEEFGDVLAWLSTLASLSGIDLAQAAEAYRDGCPTCHGRPCSCPMHTAPIGVPPGGG
jgi:NTP pyrophosphatase (non-canonical NTP hydrolase)